nr:uncharacterized protein LOC123764389 isoform X2 [Procambarus clarkii]
MDSIRVSQVEQLSLDQVAKIVPAGYKHICINDAQSGMQESKTYIVGVLQDNHEKFVRNSRMKKRMTLREVLLDGSQGLQIDVFAYSRHADVVDEYLKGANSDAKIWLVFAQVRLEEYHGHHQDGWCKFGLRAGAKAASDAQVWFITQVSPAPLPPPAKTQKSALPATHTTVPIELTNINNCHYGKKVNVCAVVKNIVKQPEMTNKGTYHILLAIVDPSCLTKDAIREDLLLHVFLNDGNYRDLPGGVQAGDILFLKLMLCEMFKDNMHGKVFDSKQVVKFSSDPSAPVTPVTTNPRYKLTDDIRTQVLTLREWWVKSRNLVNPNPYEQAHAVGLSSPDASFMPECTLNEVTEQRAFTLYCQVLEKRAVKATAQFFIMRIQDGSPTQLQFTQFDLQNTTLELLSQSECYRGIGSYEVDVLVINPTKAAILAEAGEFIQMKNVRCLENRTKGKGDFDNPMYELLFDGKVGEMVQLPRMHSEVCKILERLARSMEHNETQSFSPENDMPTLRSLAAPTGSSLLQSSVHSSPKLPSHTDSMERFIRDFQSQNDPLRSQATQENAKESSYNSHPHNTLARLERNVLPEDIADESSITFPPDLPTSTQHSPQRSHQDVNTRSNASPGVSRNSVTSEEFYDRTQNNSGLPPASPSVLSGQSSDHMSSIGPQTTSKTAKRKIDLTGEASKTFNHSPRTRETDNHSPRTRETDNHSPRTRETDNHSPRTRETDNHSPRTRETDNHSPRTRETDNHSPRTRETDNHSPRTRETDNHSPRTRETDNHSPRTRTEKVETAIDGEYTDTTITKLLAVSSPGTLYRVRAHVVNLQYLASKKCTNCKNERVCVHTWVWGLCETCGEVWDCWQLLSLHSRKDLTACTLDCFICSQQLTGGPSTKDRAATSTKGRGTVVPLIRLFLVLKDPQTEHDCLFHVSGDSAQEFLGMEPKFSWIIQNTDQQLSDLISCFLNVERLLYFGVERCVTSQDCVQYHIRHTSLKLVEE